MDFMWLCLVSMRWMIAGLCLELRMWWRSSMVLCIPLVLNATACMAGCLKVVLAVSLLDGVGVVFRFVLAGCWMSVVVCFWAKNPSNVGWNSVVGNVGVLCGIVHGAENAILMRGGACAAELRLMGSGVGSRCAMVSVYDL